MPGRGFLFLAAKLPPFCNLHFAICNLPGEWSHDISTPMDCKLGNAQLFSRMENSIETADFADDADEASQARLDRHTHAALQAQRADPNPSPGQAEPQAKRRPGSALAQAIRSYRKQAASVANSTNHTVSPHRQYQLARFSLACDIQSENPA